MHDITEFRPPTGALLLLVDGDETIASGALRRWADGVGEVKRVWTAPAHRRSGHGRRILAALEDAARRCGYRSLRIETDAWRDEAIALCTAAGYRSVPAAEPGCVSFEKSLR
jgi:GNAT superfamily N-acetyltransferase